MSIPRLGVSLVYETIAPLCGHCVSLLQNRVAAAAVIAFATIGGIIVGWKGAKKLRKALGEKDAIQLIYASAFTTGLIVMIAKCLNLPFSPRETAGIAIGSIVLPYTLLFTVLMCLPKKKTPNRTYKL